MDIVFELKMIGDELYIVHPGNEGVRTIPVSTVEYFRITHDGSQFRFTGRVRVPIESEPEVSGG